jgi:ribosomal-protein-alanine N-acetyltransferase
MALMTLTSSPYSLRPMAVADLPQIAAVEAESFPSSWPSSAYKRELQRNNLARYVVAVRQDAPLPPRGGLGRVVDGIKGMFGHNSSEPAPEYVAGFIGVWFMVDETHVVTVAVRESERRHGVGELLLLAAFDLTREKGLGVLTLECRVSNAAAQALYEKYGFQRLGIRKRYYTDNNEDALIMTTPSIEDPAYAARIEALRRQHQDRWGVAAGVPGDAAGRVPGQIDEH